MPDYYETCAYTAFPIQLCVSEDEAHSFAKEIIVKNEELQTEYVVSDPEDALQVVKTETGYNVIASVYGYTRLNACEDFLLPFLERCADPQERILIRDHYSECDYDNECLIIKNGNNSDDLVCDAGMALDFLEKMIGNGKIELNPQGLSIIKETASK